MSTNQTPSARLDHPGGQLHRCCLASPPADTGPAGALDQQVQLDLLGLPADEGVTCGQVVHTASAVRGRELPLRPGATAGKPFPVVEAAQPVAEVEQGRAGRQRSACRAVG
jgi:hypothetical protein